MDSWIADRQGNIRLAFELDETEISYRRFNKKTNKLEPLFSYEAFEKEQIDILGFDVNPNIIYASALHEGKRALFEIDISQAAPQKQLVFSDPKYDFDGQLIYSRQNGELIGFSHSNIDNYHHYWDKGRLKLQRSLKAALDGFDPVVIDVDKENNRYIAFIKSANEPDLYMLGDRKEKSLIEVGSLYSNLFGDVILDKQVLTYQARDGVTIEGYLTLPNSETKQAHPTIILPHGGPHARDYNEFDYWSQLFASRGFAVFQPNFRGSFGYGFEFEKSALQDWGGKMQDDLQDAAKWLTEQGYSKADKICIGGASYGGYAALMALVKHSESFQCAASFAGVSDLKHIAKRARFFTTKDVIRKQIGDDYDKLEQRSPAYLADKITKPVL